MNLNACDRPGAAARPAQAQADPNFAVVHQISRLPIPLPFRALKARRSVLSIENFSSAVETVLTIPGLQRNIHRIGSDPGHGRRSHRSLPRQPRPGRLAAADTGKIARAVLQGTWSGFDVGAARPASCRLSHQVYRDWLESD
jgi:hypothetical protein